MKTFNAIGGAMCFTFGILLMGSEAWMPWSQMVGVAIFAGILIFARGLT